MICTAFQKNIASCGEWIENDQICRGRPVMIIEFADSDGLQQSQGSGEQGKQLALPEDMRRYVWEDNPVGGVKKHRNGRFEGTTQ